ncbi:MAG TPA: hypothetical protein VFC43_06065, partial [Methanoregula sp.]|nr:hypothetical protein [Methanoregula sp.]
MPASLSLWKKPMLKLCSTEKLPWYGNSVRYPEENFSFLKREKPYSVWYFFEGKIHNPVMNAVIAVDSVNR